MAAEAVPGVGEALRRIDRRALTSALSVWLAVTIAFAFQIEDPWWAAMAAFRTSLRNQTAAESLRRNRLGGTVAGCLAGYIVAAFVVDNHAMALTAAFAIAAIGTYGRFAVTAGHGVLLGAAGALIILNVALFEPTLTIDFVFYRIMETLIAVMVVAIVDRCFLPYNPVHQYPTPVRHTPEELHEFAIMALAAGFTIVIMTIIWLRYDLPQPVQTIVTMMAVINVDVSAAVRKSIQRFAGVLIGGGAGLVVAGLSVESFLLWSAILAAGIAISSAYFTSGRPDQYLGQQIGYGFIMATVTGNGPVSSIMPALDRMIGILFGVVLAYVILRSLYSLLGRTDTDA